MKQVFPVLMLVMLCVGLLSFAIQIPPPARAAVTITVPDDYSTIQDAVNHANSGDTIFVRAGTYTETLEIDQSVTLTGESNQNTTIAGNIHITASDTTIQNFQIISGGIVVCIDGRTTHCSNNTIRNNIITTSGSKCETLDILASERNTVTNNRIEIESMSSSGIALLFDANYNLIDNNTITGGWTDIYCDFSQGYNTFSNNYIANQTIYSDFPTVGAMFIAHTSGNIVTENTFVNNHIGFSAPWGQPSATFYHNNLINNTYQVSIAPDSSIVWNGLYPSGGNFWSDYSGVDGFNGPYQNVTGSDGIGDTPYVIDAKNLDNYPSMSPWPHTNMVGDLNGDGKVSLLDLQLLANAYNSRPGDPNWNPLADIAPPMGIVSLTDLVTMAMHYGQHNP